MDENLKKLSDDYIKMSEDMASKLLEAFKGVSESIRVFSDSFKTVSRSMVRSSFHLKRTELTKKYVLAEFRAKSWWLFKGYWKWKAERYYNELCMVEKYASNFEKLRKTPWRLIIPELNDFPEEGIGCMDVDEDNRVYSYLTQEQYSSQMSCPDRGWICPITKLPGWFDDEWYEATISHFKNGKLDFE